MVFNVTFNNIRNKMFSNILSIFPSFRVLTDEKKFLYLFQCEEYDIVEITFSMRR
jgi:hypothetical protein